MKKNLIFVLMFVVGCNINKKDSNNIHITNKVFEQILDKFANNYSKPKSQGIKITSVSIWVNQNDTTIGLYANKKLKPEYYIGCIKNEYEEIYFYSNYKNSINRLYRITGIPKIKIDNTWDYNETYSVFYNFNNGVLVLGSVSR